MTGKVAIIGGSAESWHLSRVLPEAILWLPGGERVRRTWAQVPNIGPVTSESLRSARVSAVIEAAHPCDDALAIAVARAAKLIGLPHLQLVRPEWRPARVDQWHALRSPAEARGLPQDARVLVTLGRDAIWGLKGWRGTALVRRIGPANGVFPLHRGRFLCADGPFTVADEIRLMRKERIDWLLMRNAGGTGGWPKLAAARALGLPVAMVARPKRPLGPTVRTIREALAWLDRQNV